jgi:hypothetical protein
MRAREFEHDWYWHVEVHWDAPCKVSDGFDSRPDCTRTEYGLYRFERDHALSDYRRDVIRIGVAFNQTIATRAAQYEANLDKYRRRGSLWFSHAVLELKGQHRRGRYEAVEHLLIFATQPRENDRKIKSVPEGFYRITNSGSRGVLPRTIVYPLLHVSSR